MGCGISKVEVERIKKELQDQVERFKRDKETKEKEADAILVAKKNAENLLSKTQADKAELEKKLNDKDLENKKNVKDLKDKELDYNNLLHQSREKDQKISKVEEENRKKSELIEKMNESLKEHQGEITQLKQHGVEFILYEKNEEFRKSVEIFQDLKTKIEAQKAEYLDKDLEFNILIRDIDNKKQEIVDNQKKLDEEEEKLKGFIRRIEDQKRLIDEKVAESKLNQEALDQRLKDINDKTRALEELNSEINNSNLEINDKSNKIAENREKIEKLRNEKENLDSRIESNIKTMSDLRIQSDKLNQDISELEVEITQKNPVLDEKLSELQTIQKTFAFLALFKNSKIYKKKEIQEFSNKLEKELQLIRDEINKNESKLKEHKDEHLKIINQCEAAEKELDDLSNELSNKNREIDSLKLLIPEKEAEIHDLSKNCADLNSEKQEKKLSISEIEAEIHNLSKKCADLESEKQEKKLSISKIEAEIHDSIKKCADLDSKNQEKSQTLSGLNNSLQAIQLEISVKAGELDSSKELLSKINGKLKTNSEILSNKKIKSQKQFSYFYDDQSTFKVPFSLFMRPEVSEVLTNPSECSSNSGHVWVFSPSGLFKHSLKNNSFLVHCSSCLVSTTDQFWSCENCSKIICFTCKPLRYSCLNNHQYQPIQNLTRFQCKVCEESKLSVSVQCQECDFQICGTCSFLQDKPKVLCENHHKLKKERTIFKCLSCNKRDAEVSCECFALCQKCFQYLGSEIAGHPALVCNKQHFLHVFLNPKDKKKDCNVCKESGREMFYCKTCKVFLCDSCACRVVRAIGKNLTCGNFHQLAWNPEGCPDDGKVNGIGSFMCEICQSFLSIDQIGDLV